MAHRDLHNRGQDMKLLVPSSTGLANHEIKTNLEGVISCSCPGWRYQQLPSAQRVCSHLRRNLADPDGPPPKQRDLYSEFNRRVEAAERVSLTNSLAPADPRLMRPVDTPPPQPPKLPEPPNTNRRIDLLGED